MVGELEFAFDVRMTLVVAVNAKPPDASATCSELHDTRVALPRCTLRVPKSGYIALEREDPPITRPAAHPA
jgi:hypothetical protein